MGWVECSFILDLSVCRPKEDSSFMEIQGGETLVEACGFVGNNAQCEEITKELNLGKSTLKSVGRKTGAMIWLGAVRGRTTTSHKSQRKIMPICEDALKMSQ